ncbi:MAG TPA: endonuclease [Candidatus Stackebrandtia faecavium]|nr:endonuclease [Candidatus Stackebrandtia faecavium]
MSMRLTKKGIAVAAGAAMGAALLFSPVAVASDNPDALDAPADYYSDAEGKTGDELKTALHNIIKGHDELSYDGVKDAIPSTDADPNNDGNVILLYTGDSRPDGGDWNREHVWAKSHGDFGTAMGPGTDLHHLRPADPRTNSTRSNLDFDNGGEEIEYAPGNFYDSDSFEPRDEVKGDVARMVMYMAVRYEGDQYVDLELNEKLENGKNPFHGKQSVLVEWSEQDPPDEFEKTRNDVIYEDFQHNRNPFIDHPEWVKEIWGDGAENPEDPPEDPEDPPTDPPAECEEAKSSEPVDIVDNEIVTSDVKVEGCEGTASASSTASVEITHPDQGELSLYLYAPDGTYYVLQGSGGSGENLSETYTVDLSDEEANGTWTLSVKDYADGNTGTIDSWSLALA